MITIKMDDRKVKRAMKQMQKQIRNPRQLMKMVGENEQEKAEKRIMTSKISPDNRAWTPWAYTTAITRQREGTASRGLLYQTGNLLRSFYYKLNRKGVEIRNNAFYAKYLQIGTADMPRREFMGWGRDSMRTLPREAKKFFGKVWK